MIITYTGTVTTTMVDGVSIDTTYSGMSYMGITVIKAKFSDMVDCDRLAVKIVSDNLGSQCNLYYELQDSDGNSHMRGNYIIEGINYSEWDGSNEYIFTFLCSKLNLISL